MPFDALPRLNHINRILEQNQVSPSYRQYPVEVSTSRSSPLLWQQGPSAWRSIPDLWLVAEMLSQPPGKRVLLSKRWCNTPCHGHPFHTNFETCQLLLWGRMTCSFWGQIPKEKFMGRWAESGQSCTGLRALCIRHGQHFLKNLKTKQPHPPVLHMDCLWQVCTTSLSAMNDNPGGSPLPMMRGGEVLPQHQPGPQYITGLNDHVSTWQFCKEFRVEFCWLCVHIQHGFGEDILLLDSVCFRPLRWFSSHCGLPKRSQKIWFEAGSRSQRRHTSFRNLWRWHLSSLWVPTAEYSLSPKPMTSASTWAAESCWKMRLPIAASLGPKALSLSTDSTIYAALDIVPGRRATSNDVHRWGFLGKTRSEDRNEVLALSQFEANEYVFHCILTGHICKR